VGTGQGMAEHRPELRLAVAMRGGVSLAVWMGGGCSELDALRRARPDPTSERFWDQVLAASGYDRVTIDVLAGASAGGLNSALLACSIVHDMPFGANIRDLWLRLGDIAKLVRDKTLRARSLLDGDGAFYGPLRDELLEQIGDRVVDGAAAPARPRLDLTLTATAFHPHAMTRYQDLGEALEEPRHRVRFRFRHLPDANGPGNPEVAWSDLGVGQDRSAALARLAYAARATSSFPGAFEPASIGFATDSAEEPDDEDGHLPVTHHGVYSETRRRPAGDGPGRDYVIDGGVLDNIPVGWAVRTIAAAPARHQVHRWLLYLQPVPFETLEPPAAGRPGLSATVKRAQELRSGTEKLADDVDELARFQRRRHVQAGFRQLVEYALGEQQSEEGDEGFLTALFKRALAAADRYPERLGVIEAGRLRELWSDPAPVLGADPLGYHGFEHVNVDGGDAIPELLEQLARVPSLPEVVLARGDAVRAARARDEPLVGRTKALTELGQRIRTPQALARTVAALLDSARHLGPPAFDLKQELYGLRTQVELLIARHDRHLAAEPHRIAADQLDPVEVARRAAQRVALGHPLGAGADVPSGWPAVPFDAHWGRARDLGGKLAAVAAMSEPASPDRRPDRIRAVLSCLVSAAAAEGDERLARLEAVLVATELLTGPSRPDPLAESTRVRFHMISARNTSPLEVLQPAYEARRDGDTAKAEDKLAGNQLGNFGAFLRARWRQNDWTWGRLDATRSLVDVLTAPHVDGLGDATRDEPDRTALRTLAGLGPGASDIAVRDALVARRQEEILREELPVFAGLGASPPDPSALASLRPVSGALDARAVAPLLRTGRETVKGTVWRDPRRMWIVGRLAGLGSVGLLNDAGGAVTRRVREVGSRAARAPAGAAGVVTVARDGLRTLWPFGRRRER
jgi:patatin-related protein